MKKSSPKFNPGALVLLHICMPIILFSIIVAAAYCLYTKERDFFMGQYLFFEAIQYALASIIITLAGTVFLDIGQQESKMQ